MVKSFLHLTAIIGFLITMPSPSIGTKKNKEEANPSLSNIGEMEIDLSSYCGDCLQEKVLHIILDLQR